MRLKFFILSIFYSIFLGHSIYAQNDSISNCSDAVYIKADTYEGIIWGINCPKNIVDDKKYRWVPSEEDVEIAEKLIKEYIVKRAKEKGLINQYDTPIIHLNLDNYYRQYYGYKGSNGEKMILVNCLWKKKEKLFPDWQCRYISIFDGGSYYWCITVDLEKNICFDFFVNGNG